MVKTIEIQNFKSIKSLRLDARRVNVFIGEPNTGKSNILEALGFFSWPLCGRAPLNKLVRFERTTNLFYDESVDEALRIALDKDVLELAFKDGGFEGSITDGLSQKTFVQLHGSQSDVSQTYGGGNLASMPPVRSYKFEIRQKYEGYESAYLSPPFGDNLFSLLMGKKELKAMANRVFSKFGLKIALRPQEQSIAVVKQIEDIMVILPYSLMSDTLQRIIFYLAAVLSNKKSILVLEEPETHAFPYYTRHLAETIGLDENENQYFISTHNPYFLMPLVEKTLKQDLAIFLTYYQDYQTKVRPLTPEEVQETMEIDIFSNLDRYLENERGRRISAA